MEKQGSKLNCLFEAYCEANRSFKVDASTSNLLEIAANDLFTDVLDYSRRSIGTVNRTRQWVSVESMIDDLTQEAGKKVWESLPKFKSHCTFSTWVFQISRNVVRDAMKKVRRNREVLLLPWKAYDPDLDTHASTYSAFGSASDNDHFDQSEDSDTGSRCGRWPMLSQFYLHRDENFLMGEMDLCGLRSRLRGYDYCIFVLLADFGESAQEVAESLEWFKQDGKPDSRRVENRYRKLLKKIRQGV